MAVTIRKMTEADAPAVYQVACSCHLGSWSLDSYIAESSNPVALYKVAEEKGVVVGFVGIWCVVDEAQVMNIGVLEKNRGTGLGAALMQAVIDESRAMGCSSMTLEVRADNRAARALYAKMGFETEGKRDAYYPDGTDGLLMRRVYIE